MTTQDDFTTFWKAYPEGSRNGKPAAKKAYIKCRKRLSAAEILQRLQIWEATRQDWYTPCWPQKFLNQYIDDVEDVEMAPETYTPEWWRNCCRDAETGRAARTRFNQVFRHDVPNEIRAEYPDLYPKLRAVE